ncbi:MAG: hypothetical protein NVS2B12_26870 [Ktedonobacteraceae bacterium]
MTQKALTQDKLAPLLSQTEQAYGKYEETLGYRDENWPRWYADFMLDHLQGTSIEESKLEANKALVRRYFEKVYNQKRQDVIDELVSADCRDYGHVPPGQGLEGARRDLRGRYSGFSEGRYTIASIIAEGDYVSAYWTGHLRHNQDLLWRFSYG